MTDRASVAASHARQAERCVYGLVSDARTEDELRQAQDALRLAVGLRRMLERLATKETSE